MPFLVFKNPSEAFVWVHLRVSRSPVELQTPIGSSSALRLKTLQGNFHQKHQDQILKGFILVGNFIFITPKILNLDVDFPYAGNLPAFISVKEIIKVFGFPIAVCQQLTIDFSHARIN